METTCAKRKKEKKMASMETWEARTSQTHRNDFSTQTKQVGKERPQTVSFDRRLSTNGKSAAVMKMEQFKLVLVKRVCSKRFWSFIVCLRERVRDVFV